MATAATADPLGSWTEHRSRLARYSHTYGSDSPEAAEARRDFHAARLADAIRRTIDAAPPLTAEQRDRLATLLRTYRSGGQ